MKQKKINDILYVFDITPYQITEDTDAEVIKVQQEVVAGFKELNEYLADKIVAYNYHIACVNIPEWTPYVDQDDPEPPADTYTVYTANLYGHATLKINGETISDWGFNEVTGVADNSVVDIYPTEDTSCYVNRDGATWDTDHWTYTVNGEDLVINLDYIGPEITITLDAQNLTSENVTVKHNGNETALAGSYTCRMYDALDFYPLEDPTYYTASNMEWDDSEPGNEHWWYSVSNEDATIGLTYTAPQNNEEQPE